jgi:hypothetical protein
MSINRSYNKGVAITTDLVQHYGSLMASVITNFDYLSDAPDVLYVMMATMALESSFNIANVNGPYV